MVYALQQPTTSHRAALAPPPRLSLVEPRATLADYRAMSDAELLTHVLSGEEAAWSVFFRRFRGLILSCALKVAARHGVRLGSDDLMDVLGDVSLNLVARDYRRLRMYRVDGGSSVATWIGVIATSTAKDFLRRGRRYRHDPTAEAELDRVPCPSIGAEDQLHDRERRAFVDTALSSLSPRDQRFVELYFADAKSPEDIAGELGVSVATVYSKKAKIKTRLSELALAFA